MAEKRKRNRLHCTGEKTFTGEIPKKANEGKGKNPQISAERCRYHFWTRCPEVEKYKEVSESRCFWTECPKVRGSRSRREV